MPSKDPRSYVKPVPLPIPSQKGLRLQARSETVFNPTSPNREEVRKSNYCRRLQQMTDQGFYAYNYKPYKGLGDPFYLDEKKLILHSLGQWDENNEWESSSSSEDDEDAGGPMVAAPKPSMTAAKFVLRRTRKDLNTLSKEVVRGRNMIRNVKLGHGLFDMIKQERLAKKAAVAAERKRKEEEARNQWQPPKDSCSEDESEDDDLDKDEDLENYFGASILDGRSDDFDMASTPVPSTYDGTLRASRDGQSAVSSAKTHSSGKKKKPISPRPFTPQHTNLTEVNEYKEDISRSALFRQLCALNWILDAMNIEAGCTMGPISTCWSHLEIGGSKISAKRAREEKRAETDWERLLTNQQMGRVSKKGSVTRLNRVPRTSRHLTHPRMSIQSTSISPSSSSSQVNTIPGLAPTSHQIDAIPESRAVTPQEIDEEETLHRTGIFKFLDEYYDSLRREAQKEEEKQRGLGVESPSPHPPSDSNQQSAVEEGGQLKKKHREGRSSRKSKSAHDRQKTPDKYSRFDSPEERSRSRFILKDLRNDLNYRSKSSVELTEFHATKPSNKFANLRQDLHNKFKEVHDDKAMTLHDILEQIERERMLKCQNKFSGLHSRSMSYHRAVDYMRREGERMMARPDDRRQSSFKGNWYTDLLHSLPSDLKDVWYYNTVLYKLGKYGLPRSRRLSLKNAMNKVENTSKQSVYKFLKVLESLRHWEICSPDISAAIEFCRAKIVDMSVEEYEEWFSQAFPKVPRPKTAPAGLRSHTNGNAGDQGSGEQEGNESGAQKDGGVVVTVNGVKNGPGSSYGGSVRMNTTLGGRGGGAKSAVSVANGMDGKRRLIQSAMVRRKK